MSIFAGMEADYGRFTPWTQAVMASTKRLSLGPANSPALAFKTTLCKVNEDEMKDNEDGLLSDTDGEGPLSISEGGGVVLDADESSTGVGKHYISFSTSKYPETYSNNMCIDSDTTGTPCNPDEEDEVDRNETGMAGFLGRGIRAFSSAIRRATGALCHSRIPHNGHVSVASSTMITADGDVEVTSPIREPCPDSPSQTTNNVHAGMKRKRLSRDSLGSAWSPTGPSLSPIRTHYELEQSLSMHETPQDINNASLLVLLNQQHFRVCPDNKSILFFI
jgi:hypothetical protein